MQPEQRRNRLRFEWDQRRRRFKVSFEGTPTDLLLWASLALNFYMRFRT